MRSLVPPPLPAHARQGSVASTIRALGPGGRPSAVWSGAAFALLRMNEAECEAVALAFEDEAVSDDTRIVALDLLAGAGTCGAQAIMRRLLSLAVARREPRMFAMFVQRLAFVECPDGPTLRFLMSVYAESRGASDDVRASCAYALGAAAGQAFATGDWEAAVRASDMLRRDVLSAEAIADKCALLVALGNAGVTSDAATVMRFTRDPAAAVRSAAALALRRVNVREARARLVALLTDADQKVAHSALAALSEHKLDDDELEGVAAVVLAGGTGPGFDVQLLQLVLAQRPRLTSESGRSRAIEHALRLLLGRVEAAASTSTPPTAAPSRTAAGSGAHRIVVRAADTDARVRTRPGLNPHAIVRRR